MNFSLMSLEITDPYVLIIGAALVLIYSAICSYIAKKTKIPSVLLLIIGGIVLTLMLEPFGVHGDDLMPALNILGIVGLIMIVLEAALDLELTKEKMPLIGKTMLIALLCLIGSVGIIAAMLHYLLDMEWPIATLYATPLSIMSSAIIIPSVESLNPDKREFMIYESAFSDILGIMLFYFIISFMESGGVTAVSEFVISLVITLIVAIIASYTIVFFFKDMKSSARLFLLIAILLILYASAKLLHLAPLLIILIFGLSLANHRRFFGVFRNHWEEGKEDGIDRIEKEFHLITLETAFVVRTFFFVIFGMTINLNSLLDSQVLEYSVLIIIALYVVRWIVLHFFLQKDKVPELYIAPRGLITILLFFAIPVAYQVQSFDAGILLYVIIISSLIMTYGLVKGGRKESNDEAA